MDYFHITEDRQDLLKVSNLGLAYLGDAVYEVMVRSRLVLEGKLTPGRLHHAARGQKVDVARKVAPVGLDGVLGAAALHGEVAKKLLARLAKLHPAPPLGTKTLRPTSIYQCRTDGAAEKSV